MGILLVHTQCAVLNIPVCIVCGLICRRLPRVSVAESPKEAKPSQSLDLSDTDTETERDATVPVSAAVRTHCHCYVDSLDCIDGLKGFCRDTINLIDSLQQDLHYNLDVGIFFVYYNQGVYNSCKSWKSAVI